MSHVICIMYEGRKNAALLQSTQMIQCACYTNITCMNSNSWRKLHDIGRLLFYDTPDNTMTWSWSLELEDLMIIKLGSLRLSIDYPQTQTQSKPRITSMCTLSNGSGLPEIPLGDISPGKITYFGYGPLGHPCINNKGQFKVNSQIPCLADSLLLGDEINNWL